MCQNTEFPPSTGGIPTVNKFSIEMGVLLVFENRGPFTKDNYNHVDGGNSGFVDGGKSPKVPCQPNRPKPTTWRHRLLIKMIVFERLINLRISGGRLPNSHRQHGANSHRQHGANSHRQHGANSHRQLVGGGGLRGGRPKPKTLNPKTKNLKTKNPKPQT